ncbi:MAG TPA: transcriptional repressor LexA [Nitrospiria bacterium]|jgi:repressor LexA|nr:transcriptional repressor LexA [Nitrospiria bacterium]
MKNPLTDRQAEVLNFVNQFIARSGYPPTVREIARHLGIRGHHAVRKHLLALEKNGHLTRGRGARSIGIADQPQAVSVPILGQVAAGKPILAEENILGTLALDRSVTRGGPVFLLKIKGDSMIGAGILDGDYVLVKAQAQAENGEIAVVLAEDEATVKRVFRRGDKIVLQPENPAHQPMTFTPKDALRILGKVLGVVRFPNLN